jgi:hypothetical protein
MMEQKVIDLLSKLLADQTGKETEICLMKDEDSSRA